MPHLQELHPDQHAVLQLLLRRRMTYAAVASALGIPAEQVRERALDAVDGLAPDDVEGLTLEDRDRIAEHLLGQQDDLARLTTQKLLAEHPPARAWARLVRDELEPLAADPLPVVTDTASGGADAPAGITAAFAALSDANDAPPLRSRLRLPRQDLTPLRIAGAVVAALVVVALLLWVGGVFGGGDDGPAAATPTTTSAAAAADAGDNAAAIAMVSALPGQINFNPPQGATGPFAKAKGVGAPQAVQGVPGIVFEGAGFPAMTSKQLYAVWLVGGGKKPVRLGWFSDGKGDAPATIDKNGKIRQAFFPFSHAGSDGKASVVDPRGYTAMRITRETHVGDTPGPTVVSGSLR